MSQIFTLVSGPIWIWLIVMIAFIIGELLTVGLTSIWFAAGALCAMIAAILGGNLPVQIVVFLVVSFVMLFATRPWAKKYINTKATKTNADEHIGKVIVVAERVSNREQTGMAVVNGQEWTVRSSEDDVEFEVGQKAVVTQISGVKLIIKSFEEE